ncbi:MAG: ribonuclease H-like domain-containing protein [Treponema sp.]|jgi:uncharacterized protein YprB with RNaseH-like and TPR domain|nr:ribonuclease H-like domain-containing protein [Treponema sp.]
MGNLRLRLQRIRDARRPPVPAFEAGSRDTPSGSLGLEWVPGGFQMLTRSAVLDPTLTLSPSLPAALPILIPDLLRFTADQGPLRPETLVFFDLETTGLSVGTGTTAFLGAFGRFVPAEPKQGKPQEPGSGPYRLQVDQYLLLDYPGEPDFLATLLRALAADGHPPLLVTYNGKRFDLPLLQTRCIIHRMSVPRYYVADLLHPARRLWKGRVPDCSQGSIESLLGIDRTGDLPGALAPESWFSFLRSGETEGLLQVCEHNQRDVLGLASLFAALTHIAASPLTVLAKYRYNLEHLALAWRKTLKQSATAWGAAVQQTGAVLLEAATAQAYPRAVLATALDMMVQGHSEPGRLQLQKLAAGTAPVLVKAAAYRALAIDAEWRLQDSPTALGYVEAALRLGLRECMRKAFSHRRERLLRKGGARNRPPTPPASP